MFAVSPASDRDYAPTRGGSIGRVLQARDAFGAIDLAAVLAWVVVVSLSLARGGGYPSAWSATALAMSLTAIVIAVRHRHRLGPWSAAAMMLLGSLAVFSALSWLWSSDRPATAGEVGRWLAMAAFLVAACLAGRAASARGLLVGTSLAAATVCAVAIAARMLPSSLGGQGVATINRLAGPLGYWNALGELAAVGLLLACGLVVGAERRTAAVVAAMGVPMTAALYLTFSRGALLALLVGVALMIGLQPRRLEAFVWMALLLPCGVIAIGFLHPLSALSAAHPAQHSLHVQSAVAVVILALVSGLAALLGQRWHLVVERSLGSSAARRRTRAVALAGAAALVLVPLVAAGPTALVRGLSSSGDTAPKFRGGDLNLRLLSLSSNGRSNIWRVAWHDALDHPVAGSGDGSFAQRWLRVRPEDAPADAAHSLPLETAAELGLVGLALLVAFLALPFAAVRGVRASPAMCAAAGAVAGALAQMAIDWTWDVTAVTCAVLACVAALCVEADRASPVDVQWARTALAGAAVVVLPLSLLGLAAGLETWHAERALGSGRPLLAAHRAQTAETLAPWSARPLQIESYAWGQAHHRAQALDAALRGADRAPDEWWFQFKAACLQVGKPRQDALARARDLNPLAPEMLKFPRRCGEPLP